MKLPIGISLFSSTLFGCFLIFLYYLFLFYIFLVFFFFYVTISLIKVHTKLLYLLVLYFIVQLFIKLFSLLFSLTSVKFNTLLLSAISHFIFSHKSLFPSETSSLSPLHNSFPVVSLCHPGYRDIVFLSAVPP